MSKLTSTFLFLLIISLLIFHSNSLAQTEEPDSEELINSVIDIIVGELREKALKEVNELIQLAKDGKKDELIARLSERDYINNPDNEEDLALYAVAVEPDEVDDDRKDEFLDFFITLEQECGKMTKSFIRSQEEDNDPIGQAFSITIPARKYEEAEACTHYIVSFRLNLEEKLLVTEWYYTFANYDCQDE